MDLQTSRPHMRQQGFLWMPTPGWCLYQVAAAAAKSRQLCPTLCDPTDCSPPGSPIPGRQEGKRVNLTFGGQQLQGFGFKLQMKPSTARSPPQPPPCASHTSLLPPCPLFLRCPRPMLAHLPSSQHFTWSVLCFFWVSISSSVKRDSINNSHSLQSQMMI